MLDTNETPSIPAGRGRGNVRRGRGQSRAVVERSETENSTDGLVDSRNICGHGQGQTRARGRGGQSRGGHGRANTDIIPVLGTITTTVNNVGALQSPVQSPIPAETTGDKQLEQRIEELQHLISIKFLYIFNNFFYRCSRRRAGGQTAS